MAESPHGATRLTLSEVSSRAPAPHEITPSAPAGGHNVASRKVAPRSSVAPVLERRAAAIRHRDLEALDVDELEALYEVLEEVDEVSHTTLGRVDRAPLERAIAAALVTIYRQIGGARRRADRIVPLPHRRLELLEALEAERAVCESPVCPAPHDELGRHPAGWS